MEIQENVKNIENQASFKKELYRNDTQHKLVTLNEEETFYTNDNDFANPRNFSNLWTIVSFGRIKVDNNSISKLNTPVEALDMLLNDNTSKRVKEMYSLHDKVKDFFDNLKGYSRRAGYLIEPIMIDNNSNLKHATGNKLHGFAYTTKDKARDFTNSKQLNLAIQRQLIEELNNEIKEFNEYRKNNSKKSYVMTYYDTRYDNKVLYTMERLYTTNKEEILDKAPSFINQIVQITNEDFLNGK